MNEIYEDCGESCEVPLNNVLVVGGGGREHAIIRALLKNNHKIKIYCMAKNVNPAIADLAEMIIVDINNLHDVVSRLSVYKFDFQFAIIGPENPIALGLSDVIEANGIPCIAPRQKYAQIEYNKNFCRELIEELKPDFDLSPDYKYIPYNKPNTMIHDICTFIDKHEGNVVIKNTGLCGGKGVLVQGDHFTTKDQAKDLTIGFLHRETSVILEEKLVGEEFSLMTFCDGNGNFKHMPPIQDYKRAYDGNKGPNTGGMGCIISENNTLPFLTSDEISFAETVNEQVALKLHEIVSQPPSLDSSMLLNLPHQVNANGYRGILYGSFMKTTDNRIKVIEYNSRFGDPECLVALRLLKTDFYHLCIDIINGSLTQPIEFLKDACVCKYLVPEGYPDKPLSGFDIYFKEGINMKNMYYACLSSALGHLYPGTSRTMAYVATDKTVRKAAAFINGELEKVYGKLYFRRDIGIQKSSCLYLDSGVDIDKGNRVVDKIKPYLKETHKSGVMGNMGDFGGMFSIKQAKNEDEIILVSSTDGVGTKSIFVSEHLKEAGYYNLGTDLVNHCVNDILVSGAHPLFFLDYFASSVIDEKEVVLFVKGISKACRDNECVLIGGETAEMPDVYKENRSDLVGTIVGRNTSSYVIDGKKNIKEGDIILALPSNGLHTNGYSLIRQIHKSLLKDPYLSYLLKTHRSYLKEITYLQKKNVDIHGLCHITGGGLVDNPPRILPDNLQMNLKADSWGRSEDKFFYKWLGQVTGTSKEEMYRVFNCGVGMLIIIDSDELELVEEIFVREKVEFFEVGKINKRHGDDSVIIE